MNTSNPRILTVSDGVLKGWQVRQMAADFRAQEHIGPQTDRILRENNCGQNEKAAWRGDSSEMLFNQITPVHIIAEQSSFSKDVSGCH
ncbi:hypothetical protein [Paenibacillus silviterrae]|uniref:hypothetical protein n=1 Tax=Paenibacillus silviterrae TaxID=3242194 RepID=UPI002542F82E|nr:hypothetical protein [Paenibacillus chinjuensis]